MTEPPARSDLEDTLAQIREGGLEAIFRRLPVGYAEGYTPGPTARPTARGKHSE